MRTFCNLWRIAPRGATPELRLRSRLICENSFSSFERFGGHRSILPFDLELGFFTRCRCLARGGFLVFVLRVVIVVVAAVIIIAFVLGHVDVVEDDSDEVSAYLLDQLLGADIH